MPSTWVLGTHRRLAKPYRKNVRGGLSILGREGWGAWVLGTHRWLGNPYRNNVSEGETGSAVVGETWPRFCMAGLNGLRCCPLLVPPPS